VTAGLTLPAFARGSAVVALLAAIGFGSWQLAQSSGSSSFSSNADSLLRKRVEEYRALRKEDDFAALYKMIDPQERKKVSLARYLNVYGQGFMKLHSLEVVRQEIDPQKRTASVAFLADTELLVARLPEKFRKGLDAPDPTELRHQGEQIVPWVWRDGTWCFQLETEVVRGRDTKGQPIQPVESAPQGGAPVR
jgi:hypothetical protein